MVDPATKANFAPKITFNKETYHDTLSANDIRLLAMPASYKNKSCAATRKIKCTAATCTGGAMLSIHLTFAGMLHPWKKARISKTRSWMWWGWLEKKAYLKKNKARPRRWLLQTQEVTAHVHAYMYIYHLLPKQVAAVNFVLLAAALLLFLCEAGIANCHRSLALVSHSMCS